MKSKNMYNNIRGFVHYFRSQLFASLLFQPTHGDISGMDMDTPDSLRTHIFHGLE